MPADLLIRKQTQFVLWRPGVTSPAPMLFIGAQPRSTPEAPQSYSFEPFREIPLRPDPEFPDLWQVPARECGLTDRQVYYYWFKVQNTDAYVQVLQVMYCTDPIAWTIDRRFPAPTPADPNGVASLDPASVVLYRDGQLIACDPGGQTIDWTDDGAPTRFQPNNRIVIYELPTRWARLRSTGEVVVGTGTFRDVEALLVPTAIAPTFPNLLPLNSRAHLLELGITGLELLPPQDSDDVLNWGYGTANYFAADFDLGRPDDQDNPTAATDLGNLIKRGHQNGMRFFLDVVMAFSRNNPYRNINFLDFYVQWGSGDPEQRNRDGFGGDLFKYNYVVEGYHPITGTRSRLVPAREYMKLMLDHWMTYYRVDGLRLDSVNNIANDDFLQEFKDYGRSRWQARIAELSDRGSAGYGLDERASGEPDLGDRFLTVGEELSVPLALLQQNRLEGLWNEKFKQIVRQVILGRNWSDEPSFEQSVRKLIDCRLLGFRDGAEAVNYLTSHDVGGLANERLFNWLINNGVTDTEPRIKLAFVCLLTAVGIPMILAGDEFADQQDLNISQLPQGDTNKQIDPVNYSRLQDDWRQRIFNYVARLIRFRTTSEALATNDTQFIHADFEAGKRVMVWQRGSGQNRAIVVANFSDYASGNEYIIPAWPRQEPGWRWREVTQERIVLPEWSGREPIFPWEAKVYALERS